MKTLNFSERSMHEPTASINWSANPLEYYFALAIAAGAIARLSDRQHRSIRESLLELFYSVAVGTFFTLILVGTTSLLWYVKCGISALLTFFSAILVGLITQKLDDLRKMKLTEQIKTLATAMIAEIVKYFPKSLPTESKTSDQS